MTPESFLRRLRDSFPDSIHVYTRGSCFQLFLLLREIWPDSKPWYDGIEGHVYTEINGKFFDIKGEAEKKDHWYRLEREPRIFVEAFSWRCTDAMVSRLDRIALVCVTVLRWIV